jgi:hypothetical protein
MRRLWIILPCLMALAACTGDAPPPEGPPLPSMRASFPRGGLANVIQINALDQLPLRTAELVAPDGSTTPSSGVDVEANPATLAGRHALNDPWRSSGIAPNGLNPAPNATADPTVYSMHQLLLMASSAQIPLPDPVAYSQGWQNYKIRLGFAAAENKLDIREIPAPEPECGGTTVPPSAPPPS